MPMFLSQDEYESWAHGAPLVGEKLDAFLTELDNQLEIAKARQAQTGSGLPLPPHQMYFELTDVVIRELNNQLENKAEAQAQIRSGLQILPHQINLKSAESDGEIERLSTEASELRALLEEKNSEISEKNAAIECYVDEIENLMWSARLKEARLKEIKFELAESHASCTRISANQGRYSAEISLYKKVIKNYFQKRLVEEKSARIEFEKEAACLKEKLEKYEARDDREKKG